MATNKNKLQLPAQGESVCFWKFPWGSYRKLLPSSAWCKVLMLTPQLNTTMQLLGLFERNYVQPQFYQTILCSVWLSSRRPMGCNHFFRLGAHDCDLPPSPELLPSCRNKARSWTRFSWPKLSRQNWNNTWELCKLIRRARWKAMLKRMVLLLSCCKDKLRCLPEIHTRFLLQQLVSE